MGFKTGRLWDGTIQRGVEHCHKALRRRRTVDTPDVYIRNMALSRRPASRGRGAPLVRRRSIYRLYGTARGPPPSHFTLASQSENDRARARRASVNPTHPTVPNDKGEGENGSSESQDRGPARQNKGKEIKRPCKAWAEQIAQNRPRVDPVITPR